MKKEFIFVPHKPDVFQTGNRQVFVLTEQILESLTKQAFSKLSFTFPQEHLENLLKIANDKTASANDRYTAAFLLKNAQTASEGTYPLCQDTGIANVFSWRANSFIADCNEEAVISGAVENTYKERYLRFSTFCSKSFFDEYNPHNNMPAQIMLFTHSAESLSLSDEQFRNEPHYRFLFCAKGGGSSNKTTFLQKTKACLNETAFEKILAEQIPALGTSACPPYKICVVVGGLSPEHNLLTLKLATCGYYDGLSDKAEGYGAYRDKYWEGKVREIAEQTGLGAQFGGKALCCDSKVIRLPRHGASCPVSIGVSCSAHRNLDAYITKDGIYIEKTVTNPADLPGFETAVSLLKNEEKAVTLNTADGISTNCKKLHGLKPGTRVSVSGSILVARDAAHARWHELIQQGKTLPEYTKQYPICYAGPAETPPGKPLGSFGPTTAGRMDTYAEELHSRGAALITIAKGNRSRQWKDSCKKYGGFYLATIGGAAALISSEYIVNSRIVDYPELGMEAVRLVEVKKLPAFVIINDEGEDFYE
ncbi:MAG: fumarate hydratase C-terminal domain-containing protein [Spirochaetaceae bacterium]|nr:fumarate hydratase C-terminal domain-containing protein [Spirochaetaceae bacterium]